jgi:hypothetical protein
MYIDITSHFALLGELNEIGYVSLVMASTRTWDTRNPYRR